MLTRCDDGILSICNNESAPTVNNQPVSTASIPYAQDATSNCYVSLVGFLSKGSTDTVMRGPPIILYRVITEWKL